MNTGIKPIPEGYHTLTPYLTVRGAAEAIDFYKKAFGATELFRLGMPDGKIAHGEFRIGDSIFMISDENPGWDTASPQKLGGSAVALHLYVEDADRTFSDAIKAGATKKMPVENQFWGDRMGKVTDPFGHHWFIATHVEDVAPAELKSRMDAFCGGNKP
jgi:PhnB protein